MRLSLCVCGVLLASQSGQAVGDDGMEGVKVEQLQLWRFSFFPILSKQIKVSQKHEQNESRKEGRSERRRLGYPSSLFALL